MSAASTAIARLSRAIGSYWLLLLLERLLLEMLLAGPADNLQRLALFYTPHPGVQGKVEQFTSLQVVEYA